MVWPIAHGESASSLQLGPLRVPDITQRMAEFSKAQRKVLRDLAGQAYEAEAHRVLEELEREFVRWRANEIESSELLQAIHTFHQDQSRSLWSMYQGLKEPQIVARGSALGFLAGDVLPDDLRSALSPLIEMYSHPDR